MIDMDILDRYLQAVGFWLPRQHRKDILAEIAEDLRSQIEEREIASGHPLDTAEIEAILEHRGRPMLVARRYSEQQYFIGPVFFPLYRFVLKILAACFLVPAVLSAGGFFASRTGASGNWLPGLLGTLFPISLTALYMVVAVTVLFFILDRQQQRTGFLNKWRARNLAAIRLGHQTSRASAIWGMTSSALTFLWLLAIPHYPWLLLGPSAYYVTPAPLWYLYYRVLLAFAAVSTVENVVRVVRPAWKNIASVLHISIVLGGLILLRQMMHHPVAFDLRQGVAATAHAKGVVAIVNAVVVISLPWASIGLWIALIVVVWILISRMWEGRGLHAQTKATSSSL
ncbi:MAG: hypothetical protein ACRD28_06620, partial [Acidobacteriaceae bacterium]